jgi:hypothetical protein
MSDEWTKGYAAGLIAGREKAALESRVLAERKPIYQLRHCEYWEDVDGETWMAWVNDDDKRIVFAHPTPDDAKDAARYRWLREQDDDDFCFAVVKNAHFDLHESPEALDAAIDRAMQDKESLDE